MRGFGWRLAGEVLLAVIVGGAGERVAAGQVATTAVQDTVYLANGTTASGTMVVSWDSFTTASGAAVAAGSVSAAIGAGGRGLVQPGS